MHYYQSPYLKERGAIGSGRHHPNKRQPHQYNSSDLYGHSTSNQQQPPRYTRASSLDTPTSSSAGYDHSTSQIHNHSSSYRQQSGSKAAGSAAQANNSSTKTAQQGESIQGMLNNFSKALGKKNTFHILLFISCSHVPKGMSLCLGCNSAGPSYWGLFANC